ncbi:MAG: hypothetical protein ACRC6M_14775 [Microcystaceae cyanobacterium]
MGNIRIIWASGCGYHTETEDEIRIISMREANNNEQSLFFRNL